MMLMKNMPATLLKLQSYSRNGQFKNEALCFFLKLRFFREMLLSRSPMLCLSFFLSQFQMKLQLRLPLLPKFPIPNLKSQRRNRIRTFRNSLCCNYRPFRLKRKSNFGSDPQSPNFFLLQSNFDYTYGGTLIDLATSRLET